MLASVAAIRLRDLEVFAEVARAKSIREVARRIDSTSGQVSKAIQNLERLVGAKLFSRSVSGVLLTSQGSELLEIVNQVLSNSERIEGLVSARSEETFQRILAIAGTSFLNTYLTTPLVCEIAGRWPRTRFRFLDLAPDQIVSVGMRGGFDLAVHYGSQSWPGTWTSRSVGRSPWVLCARPGHPLAKKTSLKKILEYQFVVPTYWTSEGLVKGNDQFPIPFAKRKAGFETATADAAVPIVIATDQLAFLPKPLAQAFLANQTLREIEADDLPTVEKELFLSAKSEIVPDFIFKDLAESLTLAIASKQKRTKSSARPK